MGAARGARHRRRDHSGAGARDRAPPPRRRRLVREHDRPHHLASRRRAPREPLGAVVGGGLRLRHAHDRRRGHGRLRGMGRHPGRPHPHRVAPPTARRRGRRAQPPSLCVRARGDRRAARARPPELVDPRRRAGADRRVRGRGRPTRARRRPRDPHRRRVRRAARESRCDRHRTHHVRGGLQGGALRAHVHAALARARRWIERRDRSRRRTRSS